MTKSQKEQIKAFVLMKALMYDLTKEDATKLIDQLLQQANKHGK